MEVIKASPTMPKNVQTILTTVCEHFFISESEVLSKNRKGEIVRVRHLVMYFCLTHLQMTQIQVGRYFDRDHSSVVHAKKAIEGFNSYDSAFKRKFNKIDSIVANRLLSISIGEQTIFARIL